MSTGDRPQSTREKTATPQLTVEHIVIPPSKPPLTHSPNPNIVLEDIAVGEETKPNRNDSTKETPPVEHELGDDL